MNLTPEEVLKCRTLVRHLNKAHFKEISTAEVVEVSTLLVWFGKSVEANDPKNVKPAKVSGLRGRKIKK